MISATVGIFRKEAANIRVLYEAGLGLQKNPYFGSFSDKCIAPLMSSGKQSIQFIYFDGGGPDSPVFPAGDCPERYTAQ